MTLLYYDEDKWSSLLLLTFVRVNPKLETAISDKDNILAILSLYLSLVVFQLGVCITACVIALSS